MQFVESRVDAIFPTTELLAENNQQIRPATDPPRIPGYEVQALLGRGGMGVVYKARHLRLNRTVAIKMMIAGPYADRQQMSRFMREAVTVAGLRHAHIVQVYDVGDLDGLPYFTMEFVGGGNLAHKLAGVPQPAHQAAAQLATLTEAVQHAHQSGIVHRDLKPSNVLLNQLSSRKPLQANGQHCPSWWINSQGQTMVLIPGPVEFHMGSPESEPDRDADDAAPLPNRPKLCFRGSPCDRGAIQRL